MSGRDGGREGEEEGGRGENGRDRQINKVDPNSSEIWKETSLALFNPFLLGTHGTYFLLFHPVSSIMGMFGKVELW